MRQLTKPNELPLLIHGVCMDLLGHATRPEVSLLLGIAAVESGFVHRRQIGAGPTGARGLWQVEIPTARFLFEGHLESRPERRGKLFSLWLDLDAIPFWTPTDGDLERNLRKNDRFCCAMARLVLLTDPDPLPGTLQEQADYWKRVYNTSSGKGTVEKYLAAWSSCNCEMLLLAFDSSWKIT